MNDGKGENGYIVQNVLFRGHKLWFDDKTKLKRRKICKWVTCCA